MEERSLELEPRQEGTREKAAPVIVRFCLNEIEEHFDENLRYIREQFSMADELLRVEKRKSREISGELRLCFWKVRLIFICMN